MQERRPFLATECDDLQKAEKFRRQIIGEVSRKVAQIQNGKVFSHLFGFRCLELEAFELSTVLLSYFAPCFVMYVQYI